MRTALYEHGGQSAGSLFLSYTFIAYLVDCTKLQRTTR